MTIFATIARSFRAPQQLELAAELLAAAASTCTDPAQAEAIARARAAIEEARRSR